MARSATEICNLASDLLDGGILVDIDSQEPTAEEALYKRWYDKSRRKVLRSQPWNFAAKRAELAASEDKPAFGYNNKFPVPSDFIRLLQVIDSFGRVLPEDEYSFEGRNILCNNTAPLNIIYVYDIENIIDMDDLFVDLLVCEIALGVSFKVSDSNTDVSRIKSLRDDISKQAKSINGQENPPKRVERSYLVQSRRNAGSPGKVVIR
jgi:hypothetical protein